MLHINGADSHTYKCGEKIPEKQKEINDSQAMALVTCPICFPNGATFIKKDYQTKRTDKRDGWL